MSELLTPEQVAAILAVPRDRVIAMARGDGLPHVRIGRTYRFPEAELHAWIERHTSYTPLDGEAASPGERGGHDVPRPRPPKALGRQYRPRMVSRRPPDPAGALRIVRAGG